MMDVSTLHDWRFSVDRQGIAWAVFDREGESQNSFSRRALEELGAIVEAVERGARERTIRGLVIISGKEKGFIVGADVREFEQLDQRARGDREREPRQRLPRPHRAHARARRVLHPRLLPRRRAGAGAGLPLAHRHPRRRHPPRLPRGAARHLPRLQRHRPLHPPGRRAGGHADDADGLHDPRRRGARHGPRRRAGAEPAQPAVDGAPGHRAQAQVETAAVLEGPGAAMAGARAARQEDARRDGQEGAGGSLPGAVPPDRPVRDPRRQPGGHEGGGDAGLRASHDERHLAQPAPRVQADGDAEDPGAQGSSHSGRCACT